MSFARRIVIDTGILVSAALRPESVPALALEKALLHFEVCASAETLAELESVLLRDKFDRYAPVSLRQAFVSGLRSHLAMIDVRMTITDCTDPKDNKFLALAETCGAEIPRWIAKRMQAHGDDAGAVREFAADVVAGLCRRLIDGGAPALHFYTLNLAKPAQSILQRL